MTPDPILISDLTLVAVAFASASLAALWLSLVIWTFRDMRRRSRDILARILATLVVAVLFLPGLLIYLILRPPRTLDEEYQHSLEEEALLQSIAEKPVCPGCKRQVRDDWTVCPTCHTRLKQACQKCGGLMELTWNLCPYCGSPNPGIQRDNLSLDETLATLPGKFVNQ